MSPAQQTELVVLPRIVFSQCNYRWWSAQGSWCVAEAGTALGPASWYSGLPEAATPGSRRGGRIDAFDVPTVIYVVAVLLMLSGYD